MISRHIKKCLKKRGITEITSRQMTDIAHQHNSFLRYVIYMVSDQLNNDLPDVIRLPRTLQLEKILEDQREAQKRGELHFWLPDMEIPEDKVIESVKRLLCLPLEPVNTLGKRKSYENMDEDEKDNETNQRGKKRLRNRLSFGYSNP